MSRLSIEIPDDLHRTIKAEASLQGLSLREYVLRRLKVREPCGGAYDRHFSESGLAGIWADRDDMQDLDAWLSERRQARSFVDPADAD